MDKKKMSIFDFLKILFQKKTQKMVSLVYALKIQNLHFVRLHIFFSFFSRLNLMFFLLSLFRVIMITDFTSKNIKNFSCEKCLFYCSKKGDYNRHLMTAKHKMITNDNEITSKNITPTICNCGKKYKYASGLSRHIKICSYTKENENLNKEFVTTNDIAIIPKEPDDKRALLDVIAQNKELMDLLQEQSKNVDKLTKTVNEMIPKMGNNNTTTNNKFNLNVFLKEDCKDAINFSEFIDNIQITFEDLENQAQLGYVNGFSKLIIENLKELGLTKRPIHCTDAKRNTLYIKENDTWEKEGSQESLKKGLRKMTYKSNKSLFELKSANSEEYEDIESDFSSKCIEIQRNLLPGYSGDKNIDKIIHNISTNSVVDKL